MKNLIPVFFILSFAIISTSCTKDENTTDGTTDPTTEAYSNNFTLTGYDGKTFNLEDNQGKIVVLHFLGSTCPLCLASTATIQSDIYAKYKSNTKFAMYGIDTWNGSKALVQSFISSTGANYPMLLNGKSLLSTFSTTYDRLMILDANGNIFFKGKQAAKNDIVAVNAKLEELLK